MSDLTNSTILTYLENDSSRMEEWEEVEHYTDVTDWTVIYVPALSIGVRGATPDGAKRIIVDAIRDESLLDHEMGHAHGLWHHYPDWEPYTRQPNLMHKNGGSNQLFDFPLLYYLEEIGTRSKTQNQESLLESSGTR